MQAKQTCAAYSGVLFVEHIYLLRAYNKTVVTLICSSISEYLYYSLFCRNKDNSQFPSMREEDNYSCHKQSYTSTKKAIQFDVIVFSGN